MNESNSGEAHWNDRKFSLGADIVWSEESTINTYFVLSNPLVY